MLYQTLVDMFWSRYATASNLRYPLVKQIKSERNLCYISQRVASKAKRTSTWKQTKGWPWCPKCLDGSKRILRVWLMLTWMLHKQANLRALWIHVSTLLLVLWYELQPLMAIIKLVSRSTRKVLADLAVNNQEAFKAIVDKVARRSRT